MVLRQWGSGINRNNVILLAITNFICLAIWFELKTSVNAENSEPVKLFQKKPLRLISNQRVSHPVPSWERPEFSLPKQNTHNSKNQTRKHLLLPARSLLTYSGILLSSPSQVGTGSQKDWANILSPSAQLLDLQSEPSALPRCWLPKRPCSGTSCSPSSWGRKGDPPFPRGWDKPGIAWDPPLVPLQPAHSLPAGPRRSRAHEPHLLAQFLCSSGKSALSPKIITADRFVGTQSLEIPYRPGACQGKCQHLETLQRQIERSIQYQSREKYGIQKTGQKDNSE